MPHDTALIAIIAAGFGLAATRLRLPTRLAERGHPRRAGAGLLYPLLAGQ